MSALDRPTKRRLALGFAVGSVAKLASIVTQLVQVPVFLHFWGVPLYGEWLLLNAIPVYLSFSNVGFGTVAANEMTMLEARGDRPGALRVFQSCWWLIALLLAAVGALLALGLWLVGDARAIFGLTLIGERDTRWIIGLLGLAVLAGQFEQLYHAAYQSAERFAYGLAVRTGATLLAFAATMLAVALGGDPLAAAIAYAATSVACTAAMGVLMRRDLPWIGYGLQHARRAEICRLARPALAFMGFPIGMALNLQGTLMAVGWALGPAAVVVFSTARTVSRVALQMVQIVNNAVAPEFAMAFGASDGERLRALHRRACQLALLTAVPIVGVMLLLGPWFLHLWTGGRIAPNPGLLAALLAGVALSSLWSTSSTILYATNHHQRLAAWFLACSAVTVVASYLATRHLGLVGTALALIAGEVAMNAYVLPRAIRLSHDTGRGFVDSLRDVPSLAAGALRGLAQRLRR